MRSSGSSSRSSGSGPQRVRRADGHGLGLAIVRAIAAAHDATLTANARPEGGLDISVSFR